MRSRQSAWVVLLLAAVHVLSGECFGSGFGIYTQSASTLGQGAATIAHGDDASVIFFNPALISMLKGTQIELGTTMVIPNRSFTGAGGETNEESGVFFPSTFYASHTFNDRLSAGIGVFFPFGLGTEWPETWEGRYLATKSEMTTVDINPVVSLRLSPEIAVAAGIDILYMDTKLQKKLNFSGLGLPDGEQKLDGDGTGVGFTLGVLADLGKGFSLGASYRSRIDVDVDGTLENKISAFAPPALAALFPTTNAETSVDLPARAHVGLSYSGYQPLTVEVAVRWEGWSSFKELAIQMSEPVAGFTSSVIPKKWEDTYTFLIGGRYELSPSWHVSAGYLYSGNPVPDETFEPAIPDSNVHLLAAGLGYRAKGMRFDLSYGYQIYQDRTKNNSIDDNPFDGLFNPSTSANGEYRSDIHVVAVSLLYQW